MPIHGVEELGRKFKLISEKYLLMWDRKYLCRVYNRKILPRLKKAQKLKENLQLAKPPGQSEDRKPIGGRSDLSAHPPSPTKASADLSAPDGSRTTEAPCQSPVRRDEFRVTCRASSHRIPGAWVGAA
eukprot:718337_1